MVTHLSCTKALHYISYTLVIKNEASQKELINFLNDNTSYYLSPQICTKAISVLVQQSLIVVTGKNKDKRCIIAKDKHAQVEIYGIQWTIYWSNQLPKTQQSSRR